MENKQIDFADLMKNADYADASYNYFFLLGCGKKRQANTFKKIMDKIEKEMSVNISCGIDADLPF